MNREGAGNRLTLLRSGSEYFPALVAAIESAQKEVWLETYLFADDAIGNMYRLELGQSRGLWYFANAGGLPIIVDGQLIGAIGVGGMPANGPNSSDEECAHHGLTTVLGPQPPLPARQRPAPPTAAR